MWQPTAASRRESSDEPALRLSEHRANCVGFCSTFFKALNDLIAADNVDCATRRAQTRFQLRQSRTVRQAPLKE
jgi:hypothetical protein